MEKDKYVLLLSLCKGIGPRRFFALMDYFETAQNVLNASSRELLKVPGITEELCNNIIKNRDYDIDFYIKRMNSKGIDYVTFYDDDYPELLKNIFDPPPVLFYRGDISLKGVTVAVVGSRKPSYYGVKAASKITEGLVGFGIIIVSGMARGIDSVAQKAAINSGGKTIAVLGCGVDVVYPPENKGLYEKIVETGLVLSEYPPGTMPIAGYFPQRNRIISGLSKGVLVVEAGEKSGSLITVQMALEQGRDVFAVPGNIFSAMSMGCHKLIKEGAKLVTSAQDIVEEYGYYAETSSFSGKNENGVELSDEEKEILDIISSLQVVNIDELAAIVNMPIEKMNSALTFLEVKGIIRRLPGKNFEIRNIF